MLTALVSIHSQQVSAQQKQTFQDKVAKLAIAEWQLFDGSDPVVTSASDLKQLEKRPAEYRKCARINEFWASTRFSKSGVPTGSPPVPPWETTPDLCKWQMTSESWNVAPWSAAFISYVFSNADPASKAFKVGPSHSVYIIEAKINSSGRETNYPYFFAYPIDKASPEVGDLVCEPRADSRKTLTSFDKIPVERAKAFTSHCDIVVSVRPDRVELVGGNVGNTVAKTIVPLDSNGRIVPQKGFREWLLVIKNKVPNP